MTVAQRWAEIKGWPRYAIEAYWDEVAQMVESGIAPYDARLKAYRSARRRLDAAERMLKGDK